MSIEFRKNTVKKPLTEEKCNGMRFSLDTAHSSRNISGQNPIPLLHKRFLLPCIVSCRGNINAWCRSSDLFKRTGKVALINEAHVKSNSGYAMPFRQKLSGLLDPAMNHIIMGRYPGVLKKQTLKIERTQTSHS